MPPALAELIADSEEAAKHRALVERVEAADAKVRELRAAHGKAVEADEQAEQAFAAGRRAKLPPASVPAAGEAVEQAERELALLTRQLPASADRLFEAAHAHLDAAAAQLERLADEGDEEVERHLAAALAVLDERAEVGRQAAWIESACWEPVVSPFGARAGAVSSSPVAAELRRTLAQLGHEREEAARKRHERRVEIEMLFHRGPQPQGDGRPVDARAPPRGRAGRHRARGGRAVTEVPKAIEELARIEERREAALARAVRPFPPAQARAAGDRDRRVRAAYARTARA